MPFAPLAFDFAANAEALGRFSANVSSDAARFSPARWAGAFSSIAWRVPDALAGAALAGLPGALPGFRLALAGLYVLALAGTVRAVAGGATAWRLPVLSALAACAATIAMIVAVRETTRFYMLYAAMPPFAAWLAAATRALPSRARRRVGWGAVPVACALGVSVAVSCAWMLRAARGEIRVPFVLSAPANLSVSVPRGYASLATLASSDLDRIGARVCDAGRVRAFGELAGILDMLLNVPGRLACGASSRVELGGTGDGAPLFLVVADALPPGTEHERLGAFALGRPGQVVAPTESIPLADGASYPWRKACGPPVPVAYRFVTRGAGARRLECPAGDLPDDDPAHRARWGRRHGRSSGPTRASRRCPAAKRHGRSTSTPALPTRCRSSRSSRHPAAAERAAALAPSSMAAFHARGFVPESGQPIDSEASRDAGSRRLSP
ncbi:MAG: hypothetical protein IPG84_17890 [Betaproteobacteria bacterium]|nr:hypothetical protein [Betaproteobacteria bacterium]